MKTAEIKKFISQLSNKGKLLIALKGSPDPDVIASSFAIQTIARIFHTETDLFSFMEASLPQNKALITKLNIVIKKKHEIDYSKYNGYIVLDHQTAWIEEINTKLPCIMHIDHHAPEEDKIIPQYKIASEDVGAVSTIIAEVLMKNIGIKLEPPVLNKISTALFYGIKIDTDSFANASPRDKTAANYLSFYADMKIIKEIEDIPVTEETMTIISKAIINGFLYKDFLLCGVGFIPDSIRDSIALTADFLLDAEQCFAVIVYACIEKEDHSGLFLDASLRTSDRNFDLNRLIKDIAPYGGARKFKGAFQVDLNYFTFCPDKTLLWETISATTNARIIYSIDKNQFPSIKSIFNRIAYRVHGFFKERT